MSFVWRRCYLCGKMESLVNYGSEDEQENDSGQKASEAQNMQRVVWDRSQCDDANYDTVRMELCEDSNIAENEIHSNSVESHKEKQTETERRHTQGDLERYEQSYRKEEKDRNKPKERYKEYCKEERNRDRERRKDYRVRKEYRRDRDEHRNREHYRDRDRDRDREHKVRTDRNDGSNNRDRCRRSPSPRNRKEKRKYESRSKSGEQSSINKGSVDASSSPKTRDYDIKSTPQTSSPIPTTSKETKISGENKANPSAGLPSYYNPNVINPNKYAEQVQKRKLLWSNKKTEDNAGKWGNAKFAQDTDGKVASKFMRLMGIKSTPKNDESGTASNNNSSSDSIKKREEMFSSMEQQYEVARQVTHTMRGVGLGFNSQTRQF